MVIWELSLVLVILVTNLVYKRIKEFRRENGEGGGIHVLNQNTDTLTLYFTVKKKTKKQKQKQKSKQNKTNNNNKKNKKKRKRITFTNLSHLFPPSPKDDTMILIYVFQR